MRDTHQNGIEFRLWGKYALFTDPLTKVGGEKCTYSIPTYESLKGVVKSIYWKPTLIWVIDELRVMKHTRMQTKGTKPLEFSGGNSLAIYTFLADVEYQVRAHFEWNQHRPELDGDRNKGKHHSIALRALDRGGRQDIFLGTRDSHGYVEPCEFGSGDGELDNAGLSTFGLMFHGFDYPDECGGKALHARFWRPSMRDGFITFERPELCENRKFIRNMTSKRFHSSESLLDVDREEQSFGASS